MTYSLAARIAAFKRSRRKQNHKCGAPRPTFKQMEERKEQLKNYAEIKRAEATRTKFHNKKVEASKCKCTQEKNTHNGKARPNFLVHTSGLIGPCSSTKEREKWIEKHFNTTSSSKQKKNLKEKIEKIKGRTKTETIQSGALDMGQTTPSMTHQFDITKSSTEQLIEAIATEKSEIVNQKRKKRKL